MKVRRGNMERRLLGPTEELLRQLLLYEDKEAPEPGSIVCDYSPAVTNMSDLEPRIRSTGAAIAARVVRRLEAGSGHQNKDSGQNLIWEARNQRHGVQLPLELDDGLIILSDSILDHCTGVSQRAYATYRHCANPMMRTSS